mgnify:CR=1 FL=1
MFDKGDLVYAYRSPIRGEGWPGAEVLGVVHAVTEEGVWVHWPGGVVCLHRLIDITSIDK